MAKSIYEMTDEEIMAMELPPEPEEKEEKEEATIEPEEKDADTSTGSEEVDQEPEIKAEQDNQQESEEETPGSEEDAETATEESTEDNSKEPEVKEDNSSTGSKEVNNINDKQVDDKNNSTNILDKNSDIEVNYEDFYKKVMAPFKANGKTISLKSPDEAIQLMQMGANYTRKMQSIAPYRKTLMMLEKAQLLDEDKLSYAIDLLNGNQEAIKKLLKDTKVDPLEFNTEDNVNYQPGLNNRVSDAEVNFKSTLDDLVSTADGLNTVKEINTNWDEERRALERAKINEYYPSAEDGRNL